MGHNTLSRIPGTVYWREVVDLLEGPATSQAVIAASARAAERDLLRASDDPVFIEAVRLFLTIPLAARSDDFGLALRDAGLAVPDKPGLVDLISAATQRLDDIARGTGSRTDLGELAARSLTRTISTTIGDALPGLFAATPEDVQAVARRYSWSRGISDFTRRFFGTLLGETLSYWLDRTLDDHVGRDKRFRNAAERSAFDVELEQFTAEASRIIKEFSGGWYGKTLHRKGRFETRDAAAFGAVALKKIVAELRVRQARDA